jgi:hypothetical protein
MCCMNNFTPANLNMYDQGYTAGMYNYGQTVTGTSNRNIGGNYICRVVNVIDMSGMITKRLDCSPVNGGPGSFSRML